MTDPRKAPFGAVRLADVIRATDIDPDYPDATDGDFHLVRRHFDIRSFGVNAITGDAAMSWSSHITSATTRSTARTATSSCSR